MKKSLAVVTAIAMCVAFAAGCSTVPDTVATVNGVEISGEQYQKTLNGFLANYGLTEQSMVESMDASQVVEYKNNVISEMVLQELMMQYAAENGLDTITEEEEASVNEEVSTYLANLKTSFEDDVQAEATLSAEAAATDAQNRYEDYIKTYGYTEENLRDQYTRQLILDRVYEDVMAGSDVTDEEVRSYYDQQVAEAQAQDEEDPDGALESYLAADTDDALYVPSKAATGARYVKHILLQLPSETSTEIANLESTGDEEGATALREQAMATLKEQAEDIRQRAVAGDDFEALIAEYNEDPGMAENPDGYLVYEGASYDSAFLEDALSLKEVGDISSEPVESSYGYHIIQYASAPTPGPVPYETVQETLTDELQSKKKDQRWRDAVEAWREDADIEMHQFRSEDTAD